MIHEYAVSPGLFDSAGNVTLLHEAFGMEAGRLVSDFPRHNWEQYARAMIDRSAKDALERKVWIEALIGMVKRALYKRQSTVWDADKAWLQNALDEHAKKAFRGILHERAGEPHPDSILFGPAMVTHQGWLCPTSRDVSRNATDMLKAIAPLLDLSNMVFLSDRFFNPIDADWVNFLKLVALHLHAHPSQPRVSQIKYVTSLYRGTTEQRLEADCRTYVPPQLPRGFSVKFVVVPRELLHDRFVVTDRGAVQFGIGLDEGRDTVLVTRLAAETYLQRWHQYRSWATAQTTTRTFIFTVDGTA